MADDHALTFEYERMDRPGMVRVRIKSGDRILHSDELRPNRQSDRERFIAAVRERGYAVTEEDAEAQLLKIGEESDAPSKIAPSGMGDEVDTSLVARPELFITSSVTGITIDVPVIVGGQRRIEPATYVRWADGTRDRIVLGRTLRIADNTDLWISPEPGSMGMDGMLAWSAPQRAAWLRGEQGPDPATLLRWILERITHFVEFPAAVARGTAVTMALWVVLTYCFRLWRSVPYLRVGGPMESGKTTLFNVLEMMVFRPLSASSMSAPALYRTLHARSGTLLLDEAERLRGNSPEASEVLYMLLAGYKRGGKAIRMEKVADAFQAVQFDVFGPKALACIGAIPPTLASRCIQITMFRAGPGSPKPRRRLDEDGQRWQAIRDGMHGFILEHGASLISLPDRHDVCPPMSGRQYELWQPLLALAARFEEWGVRGLLPLMQAHALQTIEATKDEAVPEADEVLLRILVGELSRGVRPRASDILRLALEEEPIVFRAWSANGVGNVFKRYGCRSHKVNGRKEFREDSLEQMARVQVTYGIDLCLPGSGVGQREEEVSLEGSSLSALLDPVGVPGAQEGSIRVERDDPTAMQGGQP